MAEKITQALVYQELQHIKRDVGDIKTAVNGTEQSPGLKIRVDRIEQTEGLRRRMLGYVWASIGSLLVGLLVALLG